MRTTLVELFEELADLKTLIDSIKPVNDALSDLKLTVVQRYISIRKRFDDAAFSVALYSSFEKFVENLIVEYTRIESRHVDYQALPEKLKDRHLTQSAEPLFRKRLGKNRYIGILPCDVVKNLFDCLSETKPYRLNEAAIIFHDKNLYANEVDTVFSALGIENICALVCDADATRAWYRDTQNLDTSLEVKVRPTVIEERLKDIVVRRNQVAHHGGVPLNILGVDAMGDAVAFIKSLATSIFGLVVGTYFKNHHAESTNRVELVLRSKDSVYQNRKIVVVEKPFKRIFVGQPVFVILESTGARWGRVKNLRVDNVEAQDIEENTNAPNGVRVRLDFEYPNNAKVKLIALQDDDDVVWPPLAPNE
ncbi:MAG: hypothetical protein LBT86_05095 [Deltaproteobacteria bacterium]|jgi:hypothetical protein|nr:hypothetical protein [Deltaproteobacteria bacterium]